MSPVVLEALWLTYLCAVQGHIVRWSDSGTNATHLPDKAPCVRCGTLVQENVQ